MTKIEKQSEHYGKFKKYTYRKCSKVETVIIEDGMFETDSLSSKIASIKKRSVKVLILRILITRPFIFAAGDIPLLPAIL